MKGFWLWLKRYLWKNAIAFDQWVNTLFDGYPDETISSRAGKARRQGKGWGCLLCKLLDWLDKNHCEKSIEYDEGERVERLMKRAGKG